MANEPVWKKLPFARAVQWFLKKVLLPSERFDQIDREQHDHGFIIAGLTNAQALAQMHQKVTEFIEQGKTLEQFRQEFDQIATDAGWGYKGGSQWRSRVVAMTNTRTAYAAGRFQQLTDPEMLKMRPYWTYRHGGSAEPRQLHISVPPFGWNGLILPADDPWWITHFCPNGWGCSCKIFALSEADLRRRGKERPDIAPQDGFTNYTDPISGESRLVPKGIDPGFDYTPGRNPEQDKQRVYDEILKRLPDDLRQQAEELIQRQQQAS